MSESHTHCSRFEEILLDGASDAELQTWPAHLESCDSCHQQWTTHQMLEAVFAEESVPELSQAFEAGLQRKLDAAAIKIKPLRGWRVAAMAGYAMLAALLLEWVFNRFPLPSVSIDLASPWVLTIALIAVPVTMWLTIGATRWLPSRKGIGTRALGLL